MYSIDLHTHSHFSDGTLSPSDLVQAALRAGVQTLALTDHDCIDGWVQAEQAAQGTPLQLIRGVELSAQWVKPRGSKPHSVHIVGLNITNAMPLHTALMDQQQIRAQRAEQICRKLAAHLNCADPWPEVLALADGRAEGVTRTHIATWLVQQGRVQRHQQAFDRWLAEGKPAYVGLAWMSMQHAIEVIAASGGVSVLAHPTRYGLSATNTRHLIAQFAQLGGQAVELPASNEPPATRQMIDRVIAEHGLMVSIASDFHGEQMPWIKLGRVPLPRPDQRGVWSCWA
jgi:predicted metal-dependent phosphoesterase TrpH